MKQPYENVYLGNFIFALGFQAAKTRKGLNDKVVQLVQQTPDEGLLNDLFIKWSGKSYILEFKRSKEKIKKELDKTTKNNINIQLNDKNNEWALNLANKSHFLGFGDSDNLHFIDYSSIHKEIEKTTPLDKFCSSILDKEGNLGLNHEELVGYLDFIKEASGSSSEGCGGFIINVSGDGSLNMIPYDSVELLSQALDAELELESEQEPPLSFDR